MTTFTLECANKWRAAMEYSRADTTASPQHVGIREFLDAHPDALGWTAPETRSCSRIVTFSTRWTMSNN